MNKARKFAHLGVGEQLHSGEWGGTVGCNTQGDSAGTHLARASMSLAGGFLSSVSVSKVPLQSTLSSHRQGVRGGEPPAPG